MLSSQSTSKLNLNNIQPSLFFTGTNTQPQLSQEQELQDNFIEALAKGKFNEAKRLEEQGASLNKCNSHGKNTLQAAIEGANFEAVKYIDSQLGDKATKLWEETDFTTAIDNAERNRDKINHALCETLTTLHDYEKWSAANADKPWTEKYDNECLKKEVAREWWVARWTGRKVAAKNRAAKWSEAHFEDICSQKERSSPENAIKLKTLQVNTDRMKPASRDIKMEYQLYRLYNLPPTPTIEKKVVEKNLEEPYFALKMPAKNTHLEVMQSILIQSEQFLDYLQCKADKYLAMSMSISSSL